MEFAEEQPYRFQDQRQARVYRRLRLVGDGPASFFRDACKMMSSPTSFESTSLLVGHLMRETESALRDVLEPQVPTGENRGAGDGHVREIRGILSALEIPEDHPVAKSWLDLPGPGGLQSRAHRDALFRPRPVDAGYMALWNSFLAILDFILERFEQTYLDYHKLLDQLIGIPHPTTADAQRLKDQAPNNLVAQGYFFDNLTSAEWLAPLAAEGFFQRPAALERDGDTFRFIPWPPSRYLARIAGSQPEAVADVILAIPNTDNVLVLMDLAEAACELPPDQSVRLIDHAKAWASGPYAALILLPERLGRLVAHLAEGGYAEVAIDLARTVLALKRSPEGEGEPEKTARQALGMRPDAILHDWEYKEILRLQMPTLVRTAGIEALILVCDLLDEALAIDGQPQAAAEDRPILEDFSGIWRSNLAAGGHPGNEDVRNSLVTAVRAAALQLVRDNPDSIDEVVANLEGRRWLVFWRLSLDLLRESAPAGLDIACSRLADADLTNAHGLEPEHLELLESVFAALPEDCQNQILDIIKAGPDTSRLRADLDKDRYVRWWRWQRLGLIKDHLPPEWEADWKSAHGEFGVDVEVRREGEITTWVGNPEAIGVERLSEMSTSEVVDTLNGFQPGDGFGKASADDLAGELAQLIAADPGKFAPDLSLFGDVSPVYKGGVVRGFRTAAEAGLELDWDPVLQLCQQLVADTGSPSDEVSNSWRREATDLLRTGLVADGVEIPFEFRPRVWEVLEALLEDPDPSPGRESGNSSLSPYELAINTTRGRALETAVLYGVWVYRNTEPGLPAGSIFTFDDAPELRKALERHLDPAIDSSLAVRSVYGRHLPTLHGLDTVWTTANLLRFFPRDEALAGLRQAAWEGYVSYSRLNLSMLGLLREEYGRSIKQLGVQPLEDRRSPDVRLGEHLLIFYWHGRLALDDPLLVQFFEIATDEVRAQALAGVGQDLRRDDGSLEEDVSARLRDLWEWRLTVAQAGSPDQYAQEMEAFGWTFASDELGDSWNLALLAAALGIAGQTAIDHQVAERLATLSPHFPEESVRCLGLMIDGAQEVWQIHQWIPHIGVVLASALRGSDESARAARGLINRLGARGFLQFRDLLG